VTSCLTSWGKRLSARPRPVRVPVMDTLENRTGPNAQWHEARIAQPEYPAK
jgi:hypothetical protein